MYLSKEHIRGKMRIVGFIGVTYLFLISGIHGQDDNEFDIDPNDGLIIGQCGFTERSLEEPEYPKWRSEIWKQCEKSYCVKLCCTTGSKREKLFDPKATACRETTCLASTETNLCSTIQSRFVGGRQLEYEETLRDTCSRDDNAKTEDSQGLVAVCCPRSTTDWLLMSVYGAEKNEFPHMAHLSMGCGGTIYNENFILTAAHCVVDIKSNYPLKPEGITVTLGTNIGRLKSKTHNYKVSEVIVHQNYSQLRGHPELLKQYSQIYFDIALLKLERKITFGPHVKSLKMAPTGFVANEFADTAVIVGWGTADNLQVTQHLQKTNFIIRDDKRCFRNGPWGGRHQLEDQYLCVGGILDNQWSPTAGGGDSGGPAICRDQTGHPVLCGVTSFGGDDMNCDTYKSERYCKPSVYAEVQYFRKWITEKAGVQNEKTFYKPFLYGKELDQTVGHQVHITSTGGKPCGGTLVRADVVVTAAQCVADGIANRYRNIKVVSGLRDVTAKSGTVHTVKSVDVLPGFQRMGKKVNLTKHGDHIRTTDNYHKNDLAVIKLNTKVKMSASNFPKLPSMNDKLGESGMEFAFPRNTKRSGKMMQRQFTLLGKADCRTRLDRLQLVHIFHKPDDNIICGVEKYSGGSQCDRELGGGLICKRDDGTEVLCGVQKYRLCEWSIPNGFINLAVHKN